MPLAKPWTEARLGRVIDLTHEIGEARVRREPDRRLLFDQRLQLQLLLKSGATRQTRAHVLLDGCVLGSRKRSVDEPRQQLERLLVKQWLAHSRSSLPKPGSSIFKFARA